MNKTSVVTIIISVLILFSCVPSNKTEKQMSKKENEILTISGVVQSVESGKDGYTAKIKADDGEIYFVTISIPNLGDNFDKYRVFEKGETVSVKGEFWKLGNENRITVSDIPE